VHAELSIVRMSESTVCSVRPPASSSVRSFSQLISKFIITSTRCPEQTWLRPQLVCHESGRAVASNDFRPFPNSVNTSCLLPNCWGRGNSVYRRQLNSGKNVIRSVLKFLKLCAPSRLYSNGTLQRLVLTSSLLTLTLFCHQLENVVWLRHRYEIASMMTLHARSSIDQSLSLSQ